MHPVVFLAISYLTHLALFFGTCSKRRDGEKLHHLFLPAREATAEPGRSVKLLKSNCKSVAFQRSRKEKEPAEEWRVIIEPFLRHFWPLPQLEKQEKFNTACNQLSAGHYVVESGETGLLIC